VERSDSLCDVAVELGTEMMSVADKKKTKQKVEAGDDDDNHEEELERLFQRVLIISSIEYDPDDDDDEIFVNEDDNERSELAVYLAASFLDAKENSAFSGCETWQSVTDWETPIMDWMMEYHEDAAEQIKQNRRAMESLGNGLFVMFSIANAGPNAKFAVGDYVLALLNEDQEWHEAKVETVAIVPDNEKTQYLVRFVEYGNPQQTIEDNIVLDSNWLAENDTEDTCRICRRIMPLTFHHLVPKETHAHVLKRAAKSLMPSIEEMYTKRPEHVRSKSRKDWLEVYGINVCRMCHNQIHHAESNMSLATRFNTLELLLEHPKIVKWRSWASYQR
jgi:hypothetical protein